MKAETLMLYAGWAALAGALIPVMAALQGTMGRSLQSPFHAALIGVGIAFLTVGVTFAVMRPAMPSADLFAAVPRIAWLAGLAQDVATLAGRGQEVIVVTSGAIALGWRRLGLARQ